MSKATLTPWMTESVVSPEVAVLKLPASVAISLLKVVLPFTIVLLCWTAVVNLVIPSAVVAFCAVP